MGDPVYYHDIIQRSPEWFAIRAGKWTASHGAEIMGGLTTSGLNNLIKDVAWGRVFGPTDPGFQSDAMARGAALEEEAVNWFAFDQDATVEPMGFVVHPTIPNLGWSPDGLFSDRRWAVEIKCPLHRAWIDTEAAREVPSEYRWQCRLACFVGNLDGLSFLSYHPQAGGIVVPIEVTESERDQIASRIEILEPRVQTIVDRLMETTK